MLAQLALKPRNRLEHPPSGTTPKGTAEESAIVSEGMDAEAQSISRVQNRRIDNEKCGRETHPRSAAASFPFLRVGSWYTLCVHNSPIELRIPVSTVACPNLDH